MKRPSLRDREIAGPYTGLGASGDPEDDVDGGERTDLREVYAEARAAAEVLELTKRIEYLAAGTTARCPGMRTRIEAGAMARQVRDLLRALGELGKQIGGRVQGEARGETGHERKPEELLLEREIEERSERLAEPRRQTFVRELDRYGHDVEH